MQEKNKQISVLRAIACIGIVCFHTFQFSDIAYADYISPNIRLFSVIIIQLLYWAVPIFILITGKLQLNPEKHLTLSKLFKKYISRVLVSLTAFSFIYFFIDLLVEKQSFQINSILSIFQNIIMGKGWAHLWYLYMIIGLYLMLPIFRVISKNISRKTLQYFLILIVIFQSLLPLLKVIDMSTAFYIPIYTIYPFFFFLGFAIDKGIYQFSKKISVCLIAVGSAMIIILAIARWRFDYIALNPFFNYGSIFVVLQVIGIYNLSKKWENMTGYLAKMLLFIDQQSFGIYMIHIIIIKIGIYIVKFNPYHMLNLLGVVLFSLIVLIISAIFTFLLKKVPGVKKNYLIYIL